MKVFISGQKHFAEMVLRNCIDDGHEVVGVCCPLGDKYIGRLASINGIKIIEAGMLNGDTMPTGVDLGITAHSFDYIGKRTRYSTKRGWIGYHPSILPRHRGKSSIEWAIRMRDIMVGGSVYWLNAGIDRGDIYSQNVFFMPKKYITVGKPAEAARMLWRDRLQCDGINMLREAINGISNGVEIREAQCEEFSTWEPAIDKKDIYRPDSLMLNP